MKTVTALDILKIITIASYIGKVVVEQRKMQSSDVVKLEINSGFDKEAINIGRLALMIVLCMHVVTQEIQKMLSSGVIKQQEIGSGLQVWSSCENNINNDICM